MIGRSLKDRNENVVYLKNCAVHAEECWLRQRETAIRSSCGDDGMGCENGAGGKDATYGTLPGLPSIYTSWGTS